jgi:phosphonate transport system substrate-binding protein
MNPSIFIMDGNLGLAVKSPEWAQFLDKNKMKVASFTDLDKMSAEIRKNQAVFCYVPTANHFYLRSDADYQPIANAIFASNNTFKMSSVLVVPKDSPVTSLAQLKGKHYGRINAYCTSSYFSVAILLYRNGYSIHNFFSEISDVPAWQGQIDAVIAGTIDATMVQEDVWHSLPSNAEKTKIIGRIDNLPSPLVLGATNAPEALKADFMKLLLSYKASPQSKPLFSGFTNFQRELTQTFDQEAAAAFAAG